MRSAAAACFLVLAGCSASAPMAEAAQSAPAAQVWTDPPPRAQASGVITTTPVKQSAQAAAPGFGPLMTAFGNEPFWSVAVHLDVLMYKTPESLGWVPVKAQLTEEANGLRYTGKLDGKDFILVISKGACSDGMSDTVHQFKSALTIGKETHHGCARPG